MFGTGEIIIYEGFGTGQRLFWWVMLRVCVRVNVGVVTKLLGSNYNPNPNPNFTLALIIGHTLNLLCL